MKAEGKANGQLMFPGQLPSTCGGVHPATSSSFQPWLEATPPQPVVLHAQVPCAALAGVQVTLENRDLWSKFYAIGNEMIITRPGRRMFPVMQVSVSGMEHSCYYMLLLDLVPTDNFRYRFLGNCWLPVEAANDCSPEDCVGGDGRPFLHENGPCLGSQWMARPVNFGAVKLTNQKSNTAQKDNNNNNNNNYRTRSLQMMLQSMRKYVPRVHVFAGSDVQQLDYRRFKTFVFPETGFISVTSYQNEQIIALKIQNNPYARSFCSNTDRRNALKRLMAEESASDEDTNGHNSAARQSSTTESPETYNNSPTTCSTATSFHQRLTSMGPSLSGYDVNTAPSLPPTYAPYTCSTPSQSLFGLRGAYSTGLDWYSPLYNLAQQLYYPSAPPSATAGSCRPYVPSPYLNASTAPVMSPFFLPGLVGGGQSTNSASMPVPSILPTSSATPMPRTVPASSAASSSSAQSRPSATPVTSTSSLATVSSATAVFSASPLSFSTTSASQHAKINSTL
ncbi:T-box transcription factor TBX6-like [Dermacentor albipictus]|uniref:T-box transcription factor TBX6-like n=1 Tax=Dermacentor albipictus TaxID=60249 RepID=UPI0031FD9BE0